MTSKQYEELCRFFLAQELGLGIDQVLSVLVLNPRRPGLPEYQHQIDLYWESGDRITLYLNIANAKWRSDRKVEQGEVLLLQQVRQKVAAHKAVMITNTGFTEGAEAAARDDGIALHIIRPAFDYSGLDKKDAMQIQAGIQQIATTAQAVLYQHQIVHRAFDFAAVETTALPPAAAPSVASAGYSHRMMTGHETKVVTAPNKSLSGGGYESRSAGPGVGGTGRDFRTK